MTRRSFFAFVFIPAAQPPRSKFYITGGKETTDGRPRDDCAVPALITYGRDRADALANAGLTVWSSLEYFNREDRRGRPCK